LRRREDDGEELSGHLLTAIHELAGLLLSSSLRPEESFNLMTRHAAHLQAMMRWKIQGPS
jgi:hypothetical protein